jgi:hypothetical protein
MGRFYAEADDGGGGGDDSGGGSDGSQDRNPTSEYYRDAPDNSSEPQPPDLLGLRLLDDTPPSLSEQYGVTLMDDETRNQVRSWGESPHDGLSLPGDRGSPAGRGPASDGLSFSGGTGLGPGPSVSLAPGPPEYSFATPPFEGWSFTMSRRDGQTSYGLNFGVGPEFGKVEGYGALADGNVGASITPGDLGKSEVHVEGHVLSVGGRLSLDADHVAQILEKQIDDAAKRLAPGAQFFIQELGLPTP